MAENKLVGRKPKRFVVTTGADPSHTPAPNVLNREFHAERPNQKWLMVERYHADPDRRRRCVSGGHVGPVQPDGSGLGDG